MQATRDSIKYFLETPRRLLEEADIAEAFDKARIVKLSVIKTTAVLTGMPGGGGMDRSTKLAKYVDSVDDCAWAVNLVEEALRNNRKLIEAAVLTERQRAILTLRYVRHLSCARTAEKLGLTLRMVYRESNAAFDACAAYVTLEKPSYAKDCLT